MDSVPNTITVALWAWASGLWLGGALVVGWPRSGFPLLMAAGAALMAFVEYFTA